jgi:hypothetical protein
MIIFAFPIPLLRFLYEINHNTNYTKTLAIKHGKTMCPKPLKELVDCDNVCAKK